MKNAKNDSHDSQVSRDIGVYRTGPSSLVGKAFVTVAGKAVEQ